MFAPLLVYLCCRLRLLLLLTYLLLRVSLGLASLAEHLLGALLELAASLVVQLCLVLLRDGRARRFASAGGVGLPVLLMCAGIHTAGDLSARANALILLLAHVLLSVESGGLVGRLHRVLDRSRLLSNHVEHRVLKSLFVFTEAVLLPGVVGDFGVELMSLEAALKHVERGLVVGLLLKFEGAAVVHELLELVGVAPAELLEGRFNLLLLNVIVLFILGAAGQPLPGQTSFEQVEQHVADGFQIVAAALLYALMRADGGVAGGASEILAVLVGDVFALGVLVALGEAEINDIDRVFGLFSATDEEVIRFDVAVDDALLVHLLNALDHLDRNE
mgnify:CR=1 FL=1